MAFSLFLYNRTHESGVRSSEWRLLVMDTAIGRQCLLMNHLLSDLREGGEFQFWRMASIRSYEKMGEKKIYIYIVMAGLFIVWVKIR